MLKAFFQKSLTLIAFVLMQSSTVLLAKSPSEPVAAFEHFEQKVKAGGPVSVVFFGGSLTWGANASDPQRTSYRGYMMQYLQNKYPTTAFRFHDAAIGGTGSNLGIFRLDRDVFAYQPDLVFLDFTANDDLYGQDEPTLACYESLLRRMIGKGIPVVQACFGFKWNFGKDYKPEGVLRRRDHLALAAAYGTGVGDLYPLLQSKLDKGELKIDEAWAIDPVHPDDAGYAVFFEAVRNGLETAMAEKRICKLPSKPVYSDRFESVNRMRLVDHLPTGWERAKTLRTSLWYDGLTSRWMDDVAMLKSNNGEGLEAIKMKFKGQLLGLFGEGSELGLSVQVKIDGKLIPASKESNEFSFDTTRFAPKGNLFIWKCVASDLEPGEHELEIIPVGGFEGKRELRIESICVAGR